VSDQGRRFTLQRDVDVTGVSGTGTVADGIMWPDGTASVRWRGDHPSIVFWDRGWESVQHVHGHGGHTRLVWTDPADTLVRRHAAAVLQDWADNRAQLERTLSALEAKGKRIVDLDRGNGNVKGFWAILDYRDPAIIVSGHDPQELDRIVDSAAAADWEFLNDHVDDVTDSREKVLTKGLPESLCAAIAEWIEQPTLSSEELAEFVGWPVERVKAARDDL